MREFLENNQCLKTKISTIPAVAGTHVCRVWGHAGGRTMSEGKQ